MGDTAFLGRPWLAGPPGASLRLIRDCGEIERLIATLDGRAEAVENDGTATRKAEEDCNSLGFFCIARHFFCDHAVSRIGYESGLAREVK
jgi:hypothetical protein